MYDLGGALGDRTVPAGSSLLVAGPPLSGKAAIGFEVLETGATAGEGSIVVTNRDSADRVRVDFPGLFAHDAPVGIVDCVTRQQGGGTLSDEDLVQYASSPEDMTGIGIKISTLLEEFYRVRGLARNRTLFVSVSTLLMYSDPKTVFRFLHVFTSRVENADALGLFVVESDAHDEQTMNTLSQLFEGVVRTDRDGGVTLTLR